MKRRSTITTRRLRRRAIASLVAAVLLASIAFGTNRAATPYVGAAGASGWVNGFIRQTDEGLAQWQPASESSHVAGGFTDWSPDLVIDGEPLPDDVVARYWCEYRYSRRPLWRLAPLSERATVNLQLSGPNLTPATPAFEGRYRAAAAGFVLDEVARVRTQGRAFWTHAFDVADIRARNGDFTRVYWPGAPLQALVAVMGICAVVLLGVTWRRRASCDAGRCAD